MKTPDPPAKGDVDRILETLVYLYTEGRRATKEVARHLGLTGPQVTAVKMLEAFGDLSLSALSEHMSAHNSTITGLVDRMEKGALVERVRSTEDRRVVLIRLTDRGREIARSVPVTSMEVFAKALAALDPGDREALRRILRKLSDEVREELARTQKQLKETA
ncbi:MAG: MarR family winged helix-turn-helix transcriptional regulator [Myxococcota bacterium]